MLALKMSLTDEHNLDLDKLDIYLIDKLMSHSGYPNDLETGCLVTSNMMALYQLMVLSIFILIHI